MNLRIGRVMRTGLSGDHLDFIVAKGKPQNYIRLESRSEISSDRTLIIANLCSSVLNFEKHFKLCNRYTDWSNLRSMLDQDLSMDIPLQIEEDIKETVNS